MSSLFSVHSVSIERGAKTSTASMGSKKTYTAANRGSRPTTLSCRIVPLDSRERSEYAMRDLQTSHKVYTQTNPEVDEDDRLVYGSRYLYVTGVRNPDELDRYWIIEAFESTSGVK